MVKLIASSMVILLSVGCAAPQPQPEPEDRDRTVLRVQAPPVYALLGEREELRLTSEQVATIDSIGRWLHEANAPHLLTLNGAPGERTVAEEDTLLALLEEIHENNSSAGAAIEDLLNDTQEAQVCEMFAEDLEEERETREMRRREAHTDSIIGALTVWPWCGRADMARGLLREGAKSTHNGSSSVTDRGALPSATALPT